MQHEKYDVVIVGARVAGAATANFLAAQGVRVLLLDKSTVESDPLSTHALMRLGVLQLKKLGVLEPVLQSGAPLIRRTTFAYDGAATSVSIRATDDVPALLAPRRNVLDPLLVSAARSRGAEVSLGCRVVDLATDARGRVMGVVVQREGALAPSKILADWVIGADGAHSVVARLLAHESRITRQGQHRTATMYAHLPCKDDAFHWLFEAPRPGHHGRTAGVIPTHDGQACVFFSSHPDEFASYRRAPVDSMKEALVRMSHAELPAFTFPSASAGLHLRYFQGQPGFMRECIGRGWALVGDAGYFKDPSTAHGISDALRDAELLSRSILGGSENAHRAYPEQRDELSTRLFDVTCRIASLDCDNDELAQLHVALSKEMKREVEFMSSLPSLATGEEAAA